MAFLTRSVWKSLGQGLYNVRRFERRATDSTILAKGAPSSPMVMLVDGGIIRPAPTSSFRFAGGLNRPDRHTLQRWEEEEESGETLAKGVAVDAMASLVEEMVRCGAMVRTITRVESKGESSIPSKVLTRYRVTRFLTDREGETILQGLNSVRSLVRSQRAREMVDLVIQGVRGARCDDPVPTMAKRPAHWS